MKLIAALFLICFPAASFAQTKGALENPSPDSNTGGIYMFSGWACDAELIEIVIDGSSGLKAAYAAQVAAIPCPYAETRTMALDCYSTSPTWEQVNTRRLPLLTAWR